MKIDNNAVPPAPDRVGQSSNLTSGDAAARNAGKPAGTDAVQVSDTAQLAAEAARRVGEIGQPDVVRADVVDRARAAVARGEVGADLDALADRLIDGLLDDSGQ
jgi:flagellar biosynthesis anti-sigma factor FlgM